MGIVTVLCGILVAILAGYAARTYPRYVQWSVMFIAFALTVALIDVILFFD